MLLTLFKHFKHKKANLSRARAHLLLNYTQYMTVSSFRCIFRNICHFYTSYLYLYMYTVIAKFAGHAHVFLSILIKERAKFLSYTQHLKTILSINMTNFRALRANLLNYTQYLTTPCFQRPCYHFYTSYLPSMQMSN